MAVVMSAEENLLVYEVNFFKVSLNWSFILLWEYYTLKIFFLLFQDSFSVTLEPVLELALLDQAGLKLPEIHLFLYFQVLGLQKYATIAQLRVPHSGCYYLPKAKLINSGAIRSQYGNWGPTMFKKSGGPLS